MSPDHPTDAPPASPGPLPGGGIAGPPPSSSEPSPAATAGPDPHQKPARRKALTHRELYDLVWQTPMRTLAPQFGLSDVGLAKICAKWSIPRPPVGYWAKLAAGKKVRRPALPKEDDAPEDKVVLFPGPPAPPEAPEPPPIESTFFDRRLADLYTAVRAGGIAVPVGDSLRGCHPLTTQTRHWLEHRRKPPERDRWGIPAPSEPFPGGHADVRVSQGMERRALLLLDAVLKSLEGLGLDIVQPTDRWNRSVRLRVLGESVCLRIREPSRQVKHVPAKDDWYAPKWDLVPKGELHLDLAHSNPAYPYFTARDRKRAKPEDQIPDLLLAIIKHADGTRRRNFEAAEAEKRREEWRRIAREEEERRRIAEALRQQELDRRAALLKLSDHWRRAESLRGFIAECRRRAELLPEGDPAAERLPAWLAWAEEVLHDADPFARGIAALPAATHPEPAAGSRSNASPTEPTL